MGPAVLFYAIPAFVLLVIAEWYYSYKEQKDLYEPKDAFSSMALGIGNVISGFGSKVLVLVPSSWFINSEFIPWMPPIGGYGFWPFLVMTLVITGFIGVVIISVSSGRHMWCIILLNVIILLLRYVKPGRVILQVVLCFGFGCLLWAFIL